MTCGESVHPAKFFFPLRVNCRFHRSFIVGSIGRSRISTHHINHMPDRLETQMYATACRVSNTLFPHSILLFHLLEMNFPLWEGNLFMANVCLASPLSRIVNFLHFRKLDPQPCQDRWVTTSFESQMPIWSFMLMNDIENEVCTMNWPHYHLFRWEWTRPYNILVSWNLGLSFNRTKKVELNNFKTAEVDVL